MFLFFSCAHLVRSQTKATTAPTSPSLDKYGHFNWRHMLLCSRLYQVTLSSYQEIGGQKDYAVFGHCVNQCP